MTNTFLVSPDAHTDALGKKDYVQDFLSDPAVQELSRILQERGMESDKVEQYLLGIYNGESDRPTLADLQAEKDSLLPTPGF